MFEVAKKIDITAIISSIACNNRKTIEKCKLYGNIQLGTLNPNMSEQSIKFLDHPLTSIFLQRAITSDIQIQSIFTNDTLIGERLAVFTNGEPALTHHKGTFYFNFDPFYTIRQYLNEEKSDSRNFSIVPFVIKSYWKTPRQIRLLIRKIARRKRQSSIKQPDQFLGVTVNIMSKILENCFKESGFQIKEIDSLFAVTHDIDTNMCYNHGIDYIREIEKRLKLPATAFVVPFGFEYSPDLKVLEDLSEPDFEIAMHGYSHDGQLLRQGQSTFEKKISRALNFFKNSNIRIFGYRNPYVMRNEFLLKSLSKLKFLYDSSSPDVDTLTLTRPLIGLHYNNPITRRMNYGEGVPKKIVQIPISYPQDVQILDDYRLPDNEALKYFKAKIDFIKDFNGLFIFHTHPIYLLNREEFFKGVIEYAKFRKFEPMVMKDIALKYQNPTFSSDLFT
ncbi:MAG: hypothetical protein ACW98F_00420 [Candidatus Hodarchaeales archaeon]